MHFMDGFTFREKLKEIKRYNDKHFDIMHYRTNDWIHSKRVLYHMESVLPLIKEIYDDAFDENYARAECVVHDDVELIIGDVMLYQKEQMTPEEKRELEPGADLSFLFR